MKQGLFFDGINVPGNQIAVDQGFKNTVPVFTHPTYPPPAVLDHTAMTAQVALNLFILLSQLINEMR